MKNSRQSVLINIISENVISTQDELQAALEKEGYTVTQSTVSRDIKELKLVKGHDSLGNYRYLSPKTDKSDSHSREQYHDLFLRSVKSVDYALNNVVIKCYTGMASGACVAIDALFSDYMLGSLAGDDTILIVTRSEENSEELTTELNNLIKQ